MAAAIGDEAAAVVYRDLVLRTLGHRDRCPSRRIVREVELWVTPTRPAGPLATWSEQLAIPLVRSTARISGNRMRKCACKVRSHRPHPTLLIGPTFPASTSRTWRGGGRVAVMRCRRRSGGGRWLCCWSGWPATSTYSPASAGARRRLMEQTRAKLTMRATGGSSCRCSGTSTRRRTSYAGGARWAQHCTRHQRRHSQYR